MHSVHKERRRFEVGREAPVIGGCGRHGPMMAMKGQEVLNTEATLVHHDVFNC